MRNRAKCKLCNDIIESVHPDDRTACKCGEIEIWGNEMCSTYNWDNFIRIDDEGNEIIPKIVDKMVELEEKPINRKKLALNALEEMIKKIEELPQMAWTTPITHYDYYSLLLLLSALFKAEACNEES